MPRKIIYQKDTIPVPAQRIIEYQAPTSTGRLLPSGLHSFLPMDGSEFKTVGIHPLTSVSIHEFNMLISNFGSELLGKDRPEESRIRSSSITGPASRSSLSIDGNQPNRQDKHGCAIEAASAKVHENLVQLLLAKGADGHLTSIVKG